MQIAIPISIYIIFSHIMLFFILSGGGARQGVCCRFLTQPAGATDLLKF